MRSRAMPKRSAPASTTQWLVEETAQISHPCEAKRWVSSCISGNTRWLTISSKNSFAARCNASCEIPRFMVTISPHICSSSTLPFAIFLVAGSSPVADLAAHNATLDLPVEEVRACVAAPQRSVAIEDREGRASPRAPIR